MFLRNMLLLIAVNIYLLISHISASNSSSKTQHFKQHASDLTPNWVLSCLAYSYASTNLRLGCCRSFAM